MTATLHLIEQAIRPDLGKKTLRKFA